MKNIHLISTDKPSRLHNKNGELGNYPSTKLYIEDFKGNQHNSFHIYITSDEEIKEGDYFWKPDCNMIFKAEYTPHKGCQKIILTTDQDLIKDGVQAIDNEFLEWFVKNPSCEEVKIESWQTKGEWDLDYKPIIPQEEHPKQIKCYCGHTSYCDCSPLDETKQTAVEWLEEIYLTTGIDRNVHFNQAKAMEKEEIMNSWALGVTSDDNMTAEQYYNETYN